MHMSEYSNNQFPFKTLGSHLKSIREKKRESVAEVSGAVELDPETLSQIEQGRKRPSEDILMMLLNHFDVKDEEAVKIWEMAGYTRDKASLSSEINDQDFQNKQLLMLVPVDGRILYTDQVHVMANNHGVVMNFMQGGGNSSQPAAVARIGMSKEHAASVVELLTKSLQQLENAKVQRRLPAPGPQKRQGRKRKQE